MKDKNVCPNCGELYDSNLDKCPLCGTPAQVVETDDPGKRSAGSERRQRKAEAKAERRRQRAERKGIDREEIVSERRAVDQSAEDLPGASILSRGSREARGAEAVTPAAIRGGHRPVIQEEYVKRDRTRVPRFFLWLSFLILLATIVIAGSYLLWRTGKLDLPIYDKLFEKGHAATEAAPESETPADVPTESGIADTETDDPWSGKRSCKGVSLNTNKMTLTYRNDLDQLIVTTDPKDTTDEKVFTSSDEKVAKVTGVGVVTAVNPGTATITVTCGKYSATCEVVCEFGEEATDAPEALNVDHLELNKDDMSFKEPTESYLLQITNVPIGTKITWTIGNEAIATVDETGRVIAVGPGTTKVTAYAGGLTAECWVRCNFES